MNNIVFVLLGDGGCGKTSLSLRYVDDDFSHNPSDLMLGYEPRFVFFSRKRLIGVDCHITFHDLISDVNNPVSRRHFMEDGCIFVFVFDVTSKQSLEWFNGDIQQTIISDIQEHYGAYRVSIVAVGTKIDLADKRQISEKDARQFFSRINPSIPYFEVSSKTGEGVVEAIDDSIRSFIHAYMSDLVNQNEEDIRRRSRCNVM